MMASLRNRLDAAAAESNLLLPLQLLPLLVVMLQMSRGRDSLWMRPGYRGGLSFGEGNGWKRNIQ